MPPPAGWDEETPVIKTVIPSDVAIRLFQDCLYYTVVCVVDGLSVLELAVLELART